MELERRKAAKVQSVTPSRDAILAELERRKTQQPPAPPKPQAFGLNEKRAQQMANIEATPMTAIERRLQEGAVGAGQIGDVATSTLSAADKLLTGGRMGQRISSVADSAAQAVGSLPTFQKGVDVGDLASSGVQAYGALKKAHPRAVGDVEALTTFGLLTVPTARALDRVGAKAVSSSVAAGDDLLIKAAQQKRQKILDLVREPVSGTKNRAAVEMGLRTRQEGGINAPQSVAPIVKEEDMANIVLQVPNIEKGTLRAKQNAIQDFNIKHHKELMADIEANNVAIAPNKMKVYLENSFNKIKNTNRFNDEPLAEAVAKDYIDEALSRANKTLQKNKTFTASDLLQLRKDMDNWVETRVPNAFADDIVTKKKIAAVRDLRQSLNQLVGDDVPSASVRKRLAEESAMFDASRNIAIKANAEGATRFSRIANKIGHLVTLKGTIASGIALGGLGIAGASAAIPPLALTGGVLYLGTKALTSAQAKVILGTMLKKGGKLLGANDRAFIKETMDTIKDAPKSLLLASPEKMSRLPLTPEELAIERARLKAGGRVKNEGTAPVEKNNGRPFAGEGIVNTPQRPEKILQKPTGLEQLPAIPQSNKMLEAPQKPKLLTWQKQDTIVGRNGVARSATPEEMDMMKSARENEISLGFSPDVRWNLYRREIAQKYDKIWSGIEKNKRNEILKQIDATWEKKPKTPVNVLVRDVLSKRQDLRNAASSPQYNIMEDAFRNRKIIGQENPLLATKKK